MRKQTAPARLRAPGADLVPRALSHALVWTVLLALTGCGGGAPAAGALERDSAGIRIYEQPASALSSLPAVDVEESPATEVGGEDSGLYLVQGLVVLGDGTIVLANSGTRELRWYDPDGTLIRTAGREGEGPGEFRAPRLVGTVAQDTIVVWDYELRRLSYFAADGTFGRAWNVTADIGIVPDAMGVMADGAIVLMDRPILTGREAPGLARDTFPVSILTTAGGVVPVGRFGGHELFREVRGTAVSQSLLPFGRRAVVAAAADRVWAGPDAGGLELYGFDGRGTLRDIIRIDRENRRVTETDRTAVREQWLENARSGARAEIERLFGTLPLPERMGAHTDLVVDAAGRIWVELPFSPVDTQRQWLVLDGEGRVLATAALPPDLDVAAIGSDWIAGIARDEMSVEYVRLYRFRPLS